MVMARKVSRRVVDPDSNIEKVVDLGFVGEPEQVNRSVLDAVLGAELIPVLAPVAGAANGGTFNVNADTFAGAIAGSGKKTGNFAYTLVSGIASVDEEVAGVLKNKKQLNVRTRDGGTYSMTLSKKEGDKWKQEIESRIV